MRQDLSLRLLALTIFLLPACGGDPFGGLESESDFGPEVSGGGEASAATRSVTDAQTLEGMTASDQVDETSVTFFGNAANTPLQLVNSVFFDQRELDLATELFRQTLERAARGEVLVPAAGFPDCVEAGTGSVSFDDCQVMTDTTTTTMNGQVEVVEGRVIADIRVDVEYTDEDGDSLSTSTQVSADVAVTESRIEGRVDVNANASIEGGSASMVSAAIYDVELEGGCAVGGELRVGVRQKASSGGFTQKLRAIGRAVFGPECGDVTVFARED